LIELGERQRRTQFERARPLLARDSDGGLQRVFSECGIAQRFTGNEIGHDQFRACATITSAFDRIPGEYRPFVGRTCKDRSGLSVTPQARNFAFGSIEPTPDLVAA
jgi:hypothetical protein